MFLSINFIKSNDRIYELLLQILSTMSDVFPGNENESKAFTLLSHAERDQVLQLVNENIQRARVTNEHIKYFIDEINKTRDPFFIDNLFHSIFEALKTEEKHRLKNTRQIKNILHLIRRTKRDITVRRQINIQLAHKATPGGKSTVLFSTLESARNFHGRMRLEGLYGFIVPQDTGAYAWVRVDPTAPIA